MAERGWRCGSCGRFYPNAPWDCPACGKEVCENCFDRYGLCKECCKGKTDEECRALSIAVGFWWEDDDALADLEREGAATAEPKGE